MGKNKANIENCEWSEDLLKNLVDRIRSNNIVPIIGTGAFYVEKEKEKQGNPDGEDKSVQKYLVEELVKAKFPDEYDNMNLADYSSCGFNGMTKMWRLFEQNGLTLSNAIHNLFKDEKFNQHIKMRKEVYDFLEYGKFPLIITTCRFNISRLCPLRYDKKYLPISYFKGEKEAQDISSSFDGQQPIVFHLFGEYTSNDERTGVITEYDFLSYLHCLQDSKLRPNNLLGYFKANRSMFTIGCNVPNWTFRLLLYSLREDDVKQRRKKKDYFYGAVMNSPMDAELVEFLDDISFSNESDEQAIYDKINAINSLMCPEKKTRVMLSMCSQEYDTIGEELKRKLSEHFEVWFYKDHDAPDYWNRIREGMRTSQLILPVITEKALRKIRKVNNNEEIITGHDNGGEFGLIHEWWIAFSEFKELTCRPILYDTINNDLMDDLENCKLLHDFFYSFGGNASIPGKDITAEELYHRLQLNNR